MKTYLREIPSKSGNKCTYKWYAEFAIDIPAKKPRRVRLALGLDETSNKKAAEKAAMEAYAKAKEQALKPRPTRSERPRQTQPDQNMTIKTALEDYKRYLAAKGSKWRINTYIQRLTGEYESGWGFGPDALCNSVTQQDIDNIVLSRSEGGASASYLNAEISVLKSALSRAGFPVPRLRRNTLPPPKVKTRILSFEEYHRLMEELEPRLVVTRRNASGKGTHQYKIPALGVSQQRAIKDLTIFLFMTGARWGEMRNVRWSDVDFENREISLGTLKQRRGVPIRWVSMPDELHEVLLRRWADVSGFKDAKSRWVFPGAKGGKREEGVCQPLMAAFKRAGLNDDPARLARDGSFTAHGCRHQNATWLIRNKVPLPAVAKLLGHSNVNMTMRYVNLDHRETVRLANTALSGLTTQSEKPPG